MCVVELIVPMGIKNISYSTKTWIMGCVWHAAPKYSKLAKSILAGQKPKTTNLKNLQVWAYMLPPYCRIVLCGSSKVHGVCVGRCSGVWVCLCGVCCPNMETQHSDFTGQKSKKIQKNRKKVFFSYMPEIASGRLQTIPIAITNTLRDFQKRFLAYMKKKLFFDFFEFFSIIGRSCRCAEFPCLDHKPHIGTPTHHTPLPTHTPYTLEDPQSTILQYGGSMCAQTWEIFKFVIFGSWPAKTDFSNFDDFWAAHHTQPIIHVFGD